MNVMKTSLTIIPMCPRECFPSIIVCPGLSFSTKRIGPSCCTLFTVITCYSLKITLSQSYLLPTISVLAENTLLKIACHFLLLLIGFDTLTYRRDYDRSPTLVGHHTQEEQTSSLQDTRTRIGRETKWIGSPLPEGANSLVALW